ncbi:S49 family peptidase [Candidatus Pelagibacter sp.]|nr:S49 family peptidase [Candidatus Pelagibacter sp.]MDC3135655.1 S49 family peptidase [Candidatus Pelagibacter sp.]
MFSFFKKKKIVAHLRLNGVIGNAGKFRQGIDFEGQEELIKKAFSLKKAICVAITVNSPGGSPVQSHLIYKFIRQEAKKNKKKVIVFAEDVAASGGYLISCAGDEIYANSSSIIGSIGVIYSSFGFTELIKKIGIDRRVHTAGKNKSTLDPFLEEKKEDIERLKTIQLDLHKDFIDVVEKSRGPKLNKSEVELFSGEFWSGSKAKELGLIDGIGNIYEILKEKFGEDIEIKKFKKSKGWLSQKLSSSNNQVDQLANILDEKSIWQRYGL